MKTEKDKWFVGQVVAEINQYHLCKDTVTKVNRRDGVITSVLVGSTKYHANGHQEGGRMSAGFHIEPWGPKHELAIEKADLRNKAEQGLHRAPIEALRAFVASLPPEKKS